MDYLQSIDSLGYKGGAGGNGAAVMQFPYFPSYGRGVDSISMPNISYPNGGFTSYGMGTNTIGMPDMSYPNGGTALYGTGVNAIGMPGYGAGISGFGTQGYGQGVNTIGMPNYGVGISGFGVPGAVPGVGTSTAGVYRSPAPALSGPAGGPANVAGASAAGAAEPKGIWNWLGENSGSIKNIAETVGGLAQVWGGLQSNKTAREALNFTKSSYQTNLANSIQSYNTALENSARGAAAQNGWNKKRTNKYIEDNKL